MASYISPIVLFPKITYSTVSRLRLSKAPASLTTSPRRIKGADSYLCQRLELARQLHIKCRTGSSSFLHCAHVDKTITSFLSVRYFSVQIKSYQSFHVRLLRAIDHLYQPDFHPNKVGSVRLRYSRFTIWGLLAEVHLNGHIWCPQIWP